MRASNEIKVLVVEDTPQKLNEIVAALNAVEFDAQEVKLQIEKATCFSEAQTQLQQEFFDVIVLDLKIPVMPDDQPRLEISRSLYDFVRKSPAKPFYILGLTSVDDAEVAKVFTETPNFSIQRYDPKGEWLEKLTNRIEFVLGAKSGLSNYLNNNHGMDVIVITARKANEFDPIVDAIDWVGEYQRSDKPLGGLHHSFGFIRVGNDRELSVGVICLDEMGLSHSAAVAANLVGLYRPKYLVMLGMCCGLKKILDPAAANLGQRCKLGDIIVATETCCWDEGKYEDDDPNLLQSPFFNNRAVNKHPTPEFGKLVVRVLDQRKKEIEKQVTDYYKSQDLAKLSKSLKGGVKFSPNATLHWGAMVSGACVIDSHDMINVIEKRFPRALALEMEAHSIYSAADSCTGLRPRTLVIKGVADFGDGSKAKPVQAMASVGALFCFLQILENSVEIEELDNS